MARRSSPDEIWEVANLNAMGGVRTADNAVTGHATQKPVRLFEIPIANHTLPGDAVYDPFVGSGTMVIAAQKTGRTAYAMDLDPQYVQAAMTRWEQFTGQRAKPLGRRTARRRS
jgi:DNA modification methylase